jgi:hypothetical protein
MAVSLAISIGRRCKWTECDEILASRTQSRFVRRTLVANILSDRKPHAALILSPLIQNGGCSSASGLRRFLVYGPSRLSYCEISLSNLDLSESNKNVQERNPHQGPRNNNMAGSTRRYLSPASSQSRGEDQRSPNRPTGFYPRRMASNVTTRLEKLVHATVRG